MFACLNRYTDFCIQDSHKTYQKRLMLNIQDMNDKWEMSTTNVLKYAFNITLTSKTIKKEGTAQGCISSFDCNAIFLHNNKEQPIKPKVKFWINIMLRALRTLIGCQSYY